MHLPDGKVPFSVEKWRPDCGYMQVDESPLYCR